MNHVWMALGLFGQAAFSGRFLVQWWASERARKSIVPAEFWYLSIVGSVLLLGYSIYRRDVVFIVGQSTGLIIYFRNLRLLRGDGLSRARA